MIGPPTRRPTRTRAAMLEARRREYATRRPPRVAVAQPKGVNVYLARWSTLILAAVLSSPALYHAFVVKDLDVSAALTRFLIAVVVSALILAVLRNMAKGYKQPTAKHSRRTDDRAESSATPPSPPTGVPGTAVTDDHAG